MSINDVISPAILEILLDKTTQTEVANLLSLPKSEITRIKQGGREFKLSELFIISGHLGISIAALLARITSPVTPSSTLIGIFSRADHPNGYGYPNGTAHGYVILLVYCSSPEELSAVQSRLQAPFFPGHRNDNWYSGIFDLTAHIKSKERPDIFDNWGNKDRGHISIGDNRAVFILEAAEVLDKPKS